MPSIADLYSTIDSYKRRAADVLSDPQNSLMQMLGYANDRARQYNESLAQASKERGYGPKTQELAQAMAESYNPVGMTTWHGSPHTFNKFDMSKIGTGEGAQAYGHGLYLAESKELADLYRKKLTNEAGESVKDTNNSIQLKIGNLENQIKQLKESNDPNANAMIKAYQNRINEINKVGNLYKIDLPDEHIAKMLDWDKPLSQQPKNVQKAFNSIIKDSSLLDEDTLKGLKSNPDPTGKSFYNQLSMSDKIGHPSEASNILNKLDVPGIKYLDDQSRAAREGTRNFVIFDPNLAKIEERNSIPIPQDPHAPNYLEDVHKALSNKFEYPREQHFKIAQQEAEKIGQSADPYTRSLQQGYEHGWYHGTTGDITNYNPQFLGEATNAASAKKGFFFARDPQNPPASMLNNIKDKDILEFLQQGGLTPEEIVQSASMKGHGADTASGYSMLGGSREYREAMRKAKSAEKQGNWDEYDKQMQVAEDSETKRSNYLQGLTAKYGDARDTMTEKVNQTFYNLQHPQAQAELLDQKYKELMPYGWYNSYTTQQFDNLKNEITNLVGKDSAASALKEIDKFKAIKAERMAAEKTQEGGNVMPVALSYKNPLVHDFEGKAYREESYSDLVDKAKRNGNDALILKNTFDPGAGPAKLIDVGVVFDPSQIRGKFAAFDPTQSSSTNILAGVVPLSLGGAALGTSNDDVHSSNYLENLHKQLAQKPIDVTDVHAPNYLEDIHNQLANQQ